MKNTNKKRGFTLVELVIVVAVIAILTAVLVPTFAGIINRANRSLDEQVVAQMNTILADERDALGDKRTPAEALAVLEANGFKAENLSAKSKDYEMLWNADDNRIALVKKGTTDVVIGELSDVKANNWKFVSNISDAATATEAGYSVYLNDNYKGDTVVSHGGGIDVGYNTKVTNITLSSETSTADAISRAFGENTTVTINVPNANVDFYGYAGTVQVNAVKSQSMHIYGSVNKLAVVAGRVVVEDTGTVFEVTSIAEGATVKNSGYIAKAPEGATVEGTAVGGEYLISTLAQLEAFRDAVNAGNSFEGRVVKLAADITLNDGWTPIGEGARKPVQGAPAGQTLQFTGNPFRGTFDGADHIIYNLNNKGYVPTGAVLGYDDGADVYAYGFFGLVASGADIKNVTFKDVDIDTTAYAAANGDSVAACVGFSAGTLTVTNVKVYGTIIAADSVGGIVGRAYDQDNPTTDQANAKVVTVTGCENNASVVATSKPGKAAGIVGYVGRGKGRVSAVISSNVNKGNVKALGELGSVAGVVLYQGNAVTTIENNENKGNLYVNAATLTANGETRGFGYVGASATNNILDTASVTGNVNTGALYADNVKLTEGVCIVTKNCIPKGGTSAALVERNTNPAE